MFIVILAALHDSGIDLRFPHLPARRADPLHSIARDFFSLLDGGRLRFGSKSAPQSPPFAWVIEAIRALAQPDPQHVPLHTQGHGTAPPCVRSPPSLPRRLLYLPEGDPVLSVLLPPLRRSTISRPSLRAQLSYSARQLLRAASPS